jgi:hypothetical protein
MTDLEIPDIHKWVYCPISYSIFNFPVLAMDGNIYEHDFIFRWFDECRKKEYTEFTSPLTKEVLHDEQLCVCHLARQMTEAYLEKFPDKKEQQYESNFNMNILVSYFRHNHKMIYPYLKSVGKISIHDITYDQLRRCVSILDENSPLCGSQIWDIFFGKISDFEDDFDSMTDEDWSGQTIIYYEEHETQEEHPYSDSDVSEREIDIEIEHEYHGEDEEEVVEVGQREHEMDIIHEEQLIADFQNENPEMVSEREPEMVSEREPEMVSEREPEMVSEREPESEEGSLDENSGNMIIQRRLAMENRISEDETETTGLQHMPYIVRSLFKESHNHLNDSYYKDLEEKYSRTFLGCILKYGNPKIIESFLKTFPCLTKLPMEDEKRHKWSDLFEYILGIKRILPPNVYRILIEKGVPYVIANKKKDKSIVYKILKNFNRPFIACQNFIYWMLEQDEIFKKVEGLEHGKENDLFQYINDTCEPKIIRKAWENYAKNGRLEKRTRTIYLRKMELQGLTYGLDDDVCEDSLSGYEDISVIPYKYFFELCTNLSSHNIWYNNNWRYSIHYFEIIKKYLFKLGFIPTEILIMKCMYPNKLLTECLEKLPVKPINIYGGIGCSYVDMTENMIYNNYILPPTMMKDTIYSDKIFLENYFDKMLKLSGDGSVVTDTSGKFNETEMEENLIKIYRKKTWCFNPNTPGGKYVISQRVGSIHWIFSIQKDISNYLNETSSVNIFNYEILSYEKISSVLYKLIDNYLRHKEEDISKRMCFGKGNLEINKMTETFEFMTLEKILSEESICESDEDDEGDEESECEGDEESGCEEEGEIKEEKIKIDNYTDLVKTVLKEKPNKKKLQFIQPFPKMTTLGWMIYNYGVNEIMTFMISQKPVVNTIEFTGLYHAYPIHLIIKYHSCSITLLRFFMEYAKDDMDLMLPTSHGWYPLHYACRYAPGLVSELLDHIDYENDLNRILEIAVENSKKKLRLTALDILNLNRKNQYYEKNLEIMLVMNAKSGYNIYTEA